MSPGGGNSKGADKRCGDRLWRAVTRSVRPLPGRTRADEAKVESPSAAATPGARPLVSLAPPPQPTPARPERRPPQSPVQDRGPEKRVRRGALTIGRTLDLHGYTQDQAEAALAACLRAARAEGDGVVLVVTGKGGRLAAGDAAPGVLKQRLPDWLNKPALRPIVAGFAQAHRRHGGGGAFYVFLKRL